MTTKNNLCLKFTKSQFISSLSTVFYLLLFASLNAEVNLGNIRMVIGSSSTGGDTYLASSIIAKAISKKLKTSIKVDAVGAIAAFNLLKRNTDGHTIMVFHDQSYLGHIYQHKGYDDIFDQFIVGPTFASNPGNAYLVPKNSPLNNFEDLIYHVNQDKRIKVAIQPGGVSEIGFSALKNAIKIKAPGKERFLLPIKTGSQSDLNQQLFDGQADMIYGSVQANEAYTHLPDSDLKAMRFFWLTADHKTMLKTREQGYGQTSRDQLLSYVTPNVKVPLNSKENFVFDKEFFFLFNKQTDPKIIELYNSVIHQVFKDGDIQQTFAASFFSPNHRSLKDAQAYLHKKHKRINKLLNSIQTDEATDLGQSTNALLPMQIDSKSAHLYFPNMILGLCLTILILLAIVNYNKVHLLLDQLNELNNEATLKALWRAVSFLLLLSIYFLSMGLIGDLFPNRGFGFLICSIPFMFLLALMFSQNINRNGIIKLSLNSIMTPCLSWFVFVKLLNISLP